MNAGLLNRRIAIDRNYPTQDSSGDPVADWQELATIWANVTPLTGREGDIGNLEVRSEVDTRFRVYCSPLTAAVTPVDRIRYAGKVYNILRAFDVDDRHVEVRIEARAGANDG